MIMKLYNCFGWVRAGRLIGKEQHTADSKHSALLQEALKDKIKKPSTRPSLLSLGQYLIPFEEKMANVHTYLWDALLAET